jgi:hypothetical protein
MDYEGVSGDAFLRGFRNTKLFLYPRDQLRATQRIGLMGRNTNRQARVLSEKTPSDASNQQGASSHACIAQWLAGATDYLISQARYWTCHSGLLVADALFDHIQIWCQARISRGCESVNGAGLRAVGTLRVGTGETLVCCLYRCVLFRGGFM